MSIKIIKAPVLYGPALVDKIASLTIILAVPLSVGELFVYKAEMSIRSDLYFVTLGEDSVLPCILGIIVVALN